MNIGTLLGDNDLENMFQRLDGLTKSLSKTAKRSDPDVTDAALREMLKVIQSDEADSSSDTNEINKLFNKLSVSNSRLARYKTYDDIYRNVSILKRIVSVYISNSLQTDIMTNTALQIKDKNSSMESDSDTRYYRKYVDKFVKHYELEKKLKNDILPQMLRYGDHFIEIINIVDDVVDFRPLRDKQQMITENYVTVLGDHIKANENNQTNKYTKPAAFNNLVNSLYEVFVSDSEITTADEDVGSSMLYELKDEAKDTKESDFDETKFKKVILRFHKPHRISILRTKYGSTIGYVEIHMDAKKEVSPGVTAQFAQTINAMGSDTKKGKDNSVVVKGIVNKIISGLISKIELPKPPAKSDGTKVPEKEILAAYEKSILNELGEDLFLLVKQLFIEVNDKSRMIKKLNVRFIPKDRMTHICHNPIEYEPYGTSVMDSLVYPAKLYMLTQLSNVVNKLSRASMIRKWVVETGPREHHSGLVQKLKRELRNQRVSVDDIMSFKSVPNMLSDFKDVVLLSKKGQRFVDMELQQMGDANIRVADLEDFRRELIALSGVPAPYLGYNDQVELRDHLVHINVSFAAEIVNVQQAINSGISDVIENVGEILDLKETTNDHVQLTLRPPVVLLLQMIETIMASITNIQQNLQATNLNFNPYYLLKRFLPTIDWEEFATEAEEFELLMKGKGKGDDDGQGGGGGRF